MKVFRRSLVYGINTAFAALGAYFAFHADNATDRWMGIGCIVFFGGGALLMAAISLVNRGPWAAPSPPLRIGPTGNRLDRLEFFVSPARLAIVASASLLFFGVGCVLVRMIGGFVGIVFGIASIGIAFAFFGVVLLLFGSQTPIVVLELDSLTYRRPFRTPTTVRYDDIDEISISTIYSQHFVCLRAEGRLPRIVPNTIKISADQLLDLIVYHVGAHRERVSLGRTAQITET